MMGDIPKFPVHLIHLSQDHVRAFYILFPCIGQLQRIRRAVKQLHSQILLYLTDVIAECRLADEKLRRRFRKASAFRHLVYVGELSQFHGNPPFFLKNLSCPSVAIVPVVCDPVMHFLHLPLIFS